MPGYKDPVFDNWWPLFQSMILVRAPLKTTVRALKADAKRLEGVGPWRFRKLRRCEWVRIASIDELCRNVGKLTQTSEYALPTRSEWTVVFENATHCRDSLAYCLTAFHALETLFFYSTDRDSTQLAGTSFTHLRPNPRCRGDTLGQFERSVYCCNQGSRWHFEESGEPLPEEDLDRYKLRRKRDRLNEESFMALLERLGARPWRAAFYDLENGAIFRLTRFGSHRVTEGPTFEQIRTKLEGRDKQVPSEAQEKDAEKELREPPDYLRGHAFTPRDDGPARLLADGAWCGRGESEFKVFEIRCGENDRFRVQLPVAEAELSHNPPLVKLTCTATNELVIAYDSRRHPGSVYIGSTVEPQLQAPRACTKCGEHVFRVAAGFAIHPESSDANDTSWFALAVACVACDHGEIVCEDES